MLFSDRIESVDFIMKSLYGDLDLTTDEYLRLALVVAEMVNDWAEKVPYVA